MKPLILILLLAVSTVEAQKNPTLPTTSALGFNTRYDKFTDVTTISITQSLVPIRPGFVLLTVAGAFPGHDANKVVPSVALILNSNSDKWMYLESEHELRLLVNGTERIKLGDMKRVHSEIGSYGKVTESLLLEVSFSVIETLARAGKIEMQIGIYEFELKPEQIDQLKEWVSRFPAAQTKRRTVPVR